MIWPNGGAECSRDAYLSRDSFADSKSSISGESHVFSSTLIDSAVTDSQVVDSTISGAGVWESIFYKTKVSGPRLNRIVAENCELYGDWELNVPIHVHIFTGVWYRPPRVQMITGNGISISLAESTDGHAMMACWRKPIDQWLSAGPKLGRKKGWSEEQIRLAAEFFESLK